MEIRPKPAVLTRIVSDLTGLFAQVAEKEGVDFLMRREQILRNLPLCRPSKRDGR